MKPLITISIPIFKCEDFIIKCLESVRAQTYEQVEVILINDQTPDQSVVFAEEFISRYRLEKTWKIIHLQQNSGLSVVRNYGIDNAGGKYIFFLDSDDELLPHCISRLVEAAEAHDLQMVVGEVVARKLENNEKLDLFPVDIPGNILRGNGEIMRAFVKGKYPVSSWNKLINLEFLKENQLYFTPGLFAQDALHSFQMALKLGCIGFVREPTYIYYLHKDSVIHNRGKQHFEDWITIAREINRAYFEERSLEKKYLILEYLIDFKTVTLQMNWKAQKNEKLWKNSYVEYSKLKNLGITDYFSSRFSPQLKKQSMYASLPVSLGYRFFRWRYDR